MFEVLSDLAGKVPAWVLLSLTFLIGGGFTALIQAFRDVAFKAIEVLEKGPTHALRPIEVLHDSDRMWSTLDRLRKQTGALRVLLIRQENGGKLPVVGRPLTSSIDLESTNDDTTQIKMDWQAQLLDPYLTHALVRMYEAGEMELREPSVEGIMKGFMAASGGPVTHLFPVFTTEGTFYYLSLCFVEGAERRLQDPLYRDQVRASVGQLVSVFHRWYDGASK